MRFIDIYSHNDELSTSSEPSFCGDVASAGAGVSSSTTHKRQQYSKKKREQTRKEKLSNVIAFHNNHILPSDIDNK